MICDEIVGRISLEELGVPISTMIKSPWLRYEDGFSPWILRKLMR